MQQHSFKSFCIASLFLGATLELCSLEAERGLCRGYFPRHYYNGKSGKCEKFIYGGCGGNDNNFATQEECEKSCGKCIHTQSKQLIKIFQERF